MDLKEEETLGENVHSHWYYRSKLKGMAGFLSEKHYDHCLDVGAGSGFFSKALLNMGRIDRITCVDIGYSDEEIAQRSESARMRFTRKNDSTDANLILFMDVLEHVPDDVALLKEYVDKAPRGCEVFISVPAFSFLWSPHDDFLGHYRRYTTQMVTNVATHAGLQVELCRYYFGLVFPLAIARRLLAARTTAAPAKSDLKVHSPIVNGTLSLACAIERPFSRYNRLAGLSVFCTAKKA